MYKQCNICIPLGGSSGPFPFTFLSLKAATVLISVTID